MSCSSFIFFAPAHHHHCRWCVRPPSCEGLGWTYRNRKCSTTATNSPSSTEVHAIQGAGNVGSQCRKYFSNPLSRYITVTCLFLNLLHISKKKCCRIVLNAIKKSMVNCFNFRTIHFFNFAKGNPLVSLPRQ